MSLPQNALREVVDKAGMGGMPLGRTVLQWFRRQGHGGYAASQLFLGARDSTQA